MDTSKGCICRIAKLLNQRSNDAIDTAEFRKACYRSNVDPDSFSQADLDHLKRKLK